MKIYLLTFHLPVSITNSVPGGLESPVKGQEYKILRTNQKPSS